MFRHSFQNNGIQYFAASALLAALFFAAAVASAQTSKSKSRKRMNYPIAKKVDQVDDYHGIKVADPYRWLEDPDAADARAWVEAGNKVTFDFLNQIPERGRVID